jgi:multidrug efflux pump subunit AcrB
MTPLLCVRFLKVKGAPEDASYDTRFYRRYRGLLLAGLRHRLPALAAAIAVFALAMYGLGLVPNIFFPPNDKEIMTAELALPVGSPIERTEAVVRRVDAYVASELAVGPERSEGVTTWAAFVGEGAPRFMLPYDPAPRKSEYAYLVITATSQEIILSELIPKLESFTHEHFPDLRATIALLPMGPAAKAPVEVRVIGRQEDAIFTLADTVKAELANIPGIKNIRDNWGLRTKKLVVNVDQPRAQRAGLSNLDVALSLQTVLTGYETTQFREDDKLIPVTLRSVAAERDDIGKLESHNIFSQSTGQAVPLKQVADVEVVWQPAVIFRRDRLETVTVQADVELGVSPVEVAFVIDDWLKEQSENWPLGYRYEHGGELENSEKANQSIAEKLPIAGFIIVMLLVVQFNSIRRPLIILAAIPLGLIGVTVGLLVLDSYFGFMTLLGIISLAGIVINNAIVLIDRIKLERESGMEPARAVVEAAQRRLRPILLTTATTVGGLLPLYFGGGPMWEPMAIAIMFGLVFSTALTLGVVPILYSVLFGVSYRTARLKGGSNG